MPELSTRFRLRPWEAFFLGLWLVIMPDFFVNILMFLLGFILIMAGIQQIASLFSARKWVESTWTVLRDSGTYIPLKGIHYFIKSS